MPGVTAEELYSAIENKNSAQALALIYDAKTTPGFNWNFVYGKSSFLIRAVQQQPRGLDLSVVHQLLTVAEINILQNGACSNTAFHTALFNKSAAVTELFLKLRRNEVIVFERLEILESERSLIPYELAASLPGKPHPSLSLLGAHTLAYAIEQDDIALVQRLQTAEYNVLQPLPVEVISSSRHTESIAPQAYAKFHGSKKVGDYLEFVEWQALHDQMAALKTAENMAVIHNRVGLIGAIGKLMEDIEHPPTTAPQGPATMFQPTRVLGSDITNRQTAPTLQPGGRTS